MLAFLLLAQAAVATAVVIGAFQAVYILGLVRRRMKIELESRKDAQAQFVAEKWIRYAEEEVEQSIHLGSVERNEAWQLKADVARDGLASELGIDQSEAEVLVQSTLAGAGFGRAYKVSQFR